MLYLSKKISTNWGGRKLSPLYLIKVHFETKIFLFSLIQSALELEIQINRMEKGVVVLATLQEIITELDQLFDIFNGKFFNQSLIKPVIAVHTHGRDRGTMGWCTVGKVWTDSASSKEMYEVNICAEYLDLDLISLCGVLLHEMVHLYNLQTGVKDTSRGFAYHNKRFKQSAEERGLNVARSAKNGWNITTPTKETATYIESLNLNRDKFTLSRKLLPPSISQGNRSRKYLCPSCSNSVRATKDVRILCLDCQEEMELVN